MWWEIEIKRLRDMIDELDKETINGQAQRIQLCEKIAEIKAGHGLPIYVPWREQEILDKRCDWGLKHGLRQKFIRILFRLIMSESKKRQKELIEAKIC